MLDKLFLQVLNMSFTGGIIILLVLAVRLFLKKAPKVFSYALWGVVLFRLVCPFSFESVFSLLPTRATPIPQDIVYMQTPRIETGILALNNAVSALLPAATPEASVNPLQIWVLLGGLLWVLGIGVLLGHSLFSLARLKKRLAGATPCQEGVFLSPQIETAFVLGILSPKIYLPAHLSEGETTYILLHERTHLRRLDHLVKLVSFLVLCLHWFNPLVWVAFFVSGRDMEMSCDEAVIRRLGSDTKQDYSSSLLRLATGRRIVGGSPLAFGEGDTKGRIQNVLNYKRPAFWVVVVCVVAVAAIGLGLMANPKGAPPPQSHSAQSLWEAATPYVGDNSAVGRLIDLLPVPPGLSYDHFALQTASEPYQIEIVYSLPTDLLETYEGEHPDDVAAPFQKNALLLLALVDNAGEIQASLTDGARALRFTHGREWAEHTVGGDVREYAQSPETLQTLIDLPLATEPEYTIFRLGKGGQVVTGYSSTDGELARAVIMDALIRSAAWEGVDVSTLEEGFLIQQRFPETEEGHDCYAFRLEDGRAVFQGGPQGLYTTLSEDLYAQLEAAFAPLTLSVVPFWVKPDEPPQVIGESAATAWLQSFTAPATPAEERIGSYSITEVSVIVGEPKEGETWEEMAYHYVVQVTYSITTDSEDYLAPGDGVSDLGTFEGLFRELHVREVLDPGGGFEVVGVGTGGGAQAFRQPQ